MVQTGIKVKCCNTVWYVCNIRSLWLESINTSIHVSLYAPCVPAKLLYAIVHWLSFRRMSSYKKVILGKILHSLSCLAYWTVYS